MTRSTADVRRTDAFLRLARAAAALLHESQRERGVSALHVKSGRRLFASELAAQRSRTEARRRGVAALVDSVGAELLDDAPRRAERLAATADGVVAVRAEIEREAVTPDRVVDVFSAFNAELLSAIDDGVTHLGEEEARGLALATLALEHAKEKTGLERARLGAAFVGGGPDERDRVALAELVASRATYLHMYGLTAPAPAAQMLRRVLAAPSAVEVKRIEERVISARASRVAPVDANAWFSTISRTIEMLGDVSNATLSYFPYA
jgi:methyl-accepting chemotaxis protein